MTKAKIIIIIGNNVWPQYSLDSREKCPRLGSFDNSELIVPAW